MAANKEKLLESAQKNLKKKQIAKAIKDYVKVVEIDGGYHDQTIEADLRRQEQLQKLGWIVIRFTLLKLQQFYH